LSVKDVDLNKYIVTPDDWENYHHRNRIYKKEKGIIPQVVDKLVEDRDKIKYIIDKYKYEFGEDKVTLNPDYDPVKYKALYLEQYAIKTDANSIYGILSFPLSRYYSWELGDSVTTCARATIKECYKLLLEWGCEAIGGDTDSTFVDLKGQDYKIINQKFVEFLKSWAIKWGAPENKLVFEWEKQFIPFLFVKKKNYAYIDKGGNIKIVGMEAIKSDTNPRAAKLQKQLIIDILSKRVDLDIWENRIDEIYNQVYDQELNQDELVLTKALTKMPSEYEGYVIAKATGEPKVKADGTLQKKSIPAHVKLAERLLKKGVDLYPGSKIHFIVIKTKPNLAISLEEYAKGEGIFITKHKKIQEFEYEFDGGYDATYYWTRIITPFMKVLYVFNKGLPDWNWGLTQSALNKIVKKLGKDDDDDE
jgi:DNA polymerase elongation subunit (family B)